MMHSRLTLPGNFLSHTLLRIPPRPRQTRANPHPPHPPKCENTKCPMPTEAYGAQLPWRQCPVRPWSSLAMPRCQRFSWPLFGARPEGRGGQQKSVAKTEKNESFRKQDGTNLKDSRSKTSYKIVYIFCLRQHGLFINIGEHKKSTTL